MELMIGFPNGDERKVVVSSARRAINRKTGMKELVINYVDGGNKHYTPLVNILGKWYKNLDWVDYGEYAFESVEYDYLSDLSMNIEICDAYSEYSEEEIVNYCNNFRNKVNNIIGRRKPEFLNNNSVNDYLDELYSRMKSAVGKVLKSNNISVRGFVYWINEEILFKMSSSLEDVNSLINIIRNGCSRYSNIDVSTITERYERISKFTALTSRYGKEHLNFVVFAISEVDILAMSSEEFDKYVADLNSDLDQLTDKMLNSNVLSKFVGAMKTAIKYKKSINENNNVVENDVKENMNVFVVVDPISLVNDEEVRVLFYSCTKNEVDFTMKFLPVFASDEVTRDIKGYLKIAKNNGSLLPLQLKDKNGNDIVYYFGICDNKGKFNYLMNSHGSMDMIQVDVTKKSIEGINFEDIFNKGMNGAYTLRIPARGRIYYGLEN